MSECVVALGEGIGGALYVGGATVLSSTLSVAGTSSHAGVATFTSTTASTSTSTGAVVVTGGQGISGSLNVGGNISITVFPILGSSSLVHFHAVAVYLTCCHVVTFALPFAAFISSGTVRFCYYWWCSGWCVLHGVPLSHKRFLQCRLHQFEPSGIYF